MMTLMEPDNPIKTTLDVAVRLDIEEPGLWYAEPKADGWRRPLYFQNGIWTTVAKYATGEQAKSSPPEHLMKELASLKFPEGTAFDAEWMGKRQVQSTHGRHWLILLDILYYGGQWQGDVPYEGRKKNMTTLVELHMAKEWNIEQRMHANILVCPHVESGFKALYEKQRDDPAKLTEGIVLKRRASRLVGGGDNPDWLKIRYRG